MSAVSILSTWKWEREGHPHLFWQTQNALLVNKLIFWKVTICFKFFFLSSSCHLESEMECHFARQGCRQSCWKLCVCSSQHCLTKLPAWLGCHGLLLCSWLWTGKEAHPWIPITCSCSSLPALSWKTYCGSRQQLSPSLPSVLLLVPVSKSRCGIHQSSLSISLHTCWEFWWIWISGRAQEQQVRKGEKLDFSKYMENWHFRAISDCFKSLKKVRRTQDVLLKMQFQFFQLNLPFPSPFLTVSWTVTLVSLIWFCCASSFPLQGEVLCPSNPDRNFLERINGMIN